MLTIFGRPRVLAAWTNSITPYEVSLETPIYRTCHWIQQHLMSSLTKLSLNTTILKEHISCSSNKKVEIIYQKRKKKERKRKLNVCRRKINGTFLLQYVTWKIFLTDLWEGHKDSLTNLSLINNFFKGFQLFHESYAWSPLCIVIWKFTKNWNITVWPEITWFGKTQVKF